VTKNYEFSGAVGEKALSDLFCGRSQLVVYHFMFAPEWNEGCSHCSFWADNFDGLDIHLNQKDVTLVAISRAPFSKLEDYRKRMGWSFEWVSSENTEFNYDFGVSFTESQVAKSSAYCNYKTQDPEVSDREGISVFLKDKEGKIFHTYSTFARGIDLQNTVYNYLDLVPKGRDESGVGQSWVRRHDEYSKK
jgi:predicted dithiol-disulfide oxidoreductase (DUF899 family)